MFMLIIMYFAERVSVRILTDGVTLLLDVHNRIIVNSECVTTDVI